MEKKSPIILRLKKGISEMLLLTLLYEDDMYGYQLASEIKKRTDGVCAINESSMYPILNRLLEQEIISQSYTTTENHKVRVYYHLEDKGKHYYEEMRSDFENYLSAVYQLLASTEAEKHAITDNEH